MHKLLSISFIIKLYAQKYIYLNTFKFSQKLKLLEKDIWFQTSFDAYSCWNLFTSNAELSTLTLDASY